jgi:diguanylate cyclase (GGDEF)-like protein
MPDDIVFPSIKCYAKLRGIDEVSTTVRGDGRFLGLGAPLGSIIGRGLWIHRAWWSAWLTADTHIHAYFYLYMAIGCVLVFAAFGFVLGSRADEMRQEGADLTDTFQTLNLLAIKDGLTGIYNHRYLQERLGLELEVADRRQTPLTCLMIDLDNFKSVNDRFGHPFGDTVLIGIARIIRESIRHIDTAGRYGGEEFLILMPQTPSDVAQVIAERIRKAVEKHAFTANENCVKVTLSIGIATYPMPGMNAEDKGAFLKEVDEALYQAKRSGKNRVFYQAAKNHGRALL